jgi:hypothetical protein
VAGPLARGHSCRLAAVKRPSDPIHCHHITLGCCELTPDQIVDRLRLLRVKRSQLLIALSVVFTLALRSSLFLCFSLYSAIKAHSAARRNIRTVPRYPKCSSIG